MKKIILIALGVVALAILLIALAGMYKFNYLASKDDHDVDGNKMNASHKSAAYNIEGNLIQLKNGMAVSQEAPDSASRVTTSYFGNELKTDLNNDGREDVVFIVTQESGGSGTFFYAVAALNTDDGWMGSDGFFLGDRIAPQSTELSQNPSHKNVVVVNYADRAAGQAMSEDPTVGQSVWLKLDSDTMRWGEVAQNFPGEASPDVMALDMKTWTWVRTTYNNDTQVIPKDPEAFTLTFNADGSVSATTDCNAMSGSYEVSGNQITFGPMVMTKMFCPDSQEQAFASALAEAQSFLFTARGELVLELPLDSGSVIFR